LHPDFIVLDLYVPVMNGFDAARALKDLPPSVTDKARDLLYRKVAYLFFLIGKTKLIPL
jgi:CheY-like chemotaxis protein